MEGRLWDMVGAVEAVLTANQAALTLVKGLGLRPNVIVGHSTGEFSALRAAGILDPDREEFSELCLKLHSNYEEAAQTGVPRAVLLAVGADRDRVEAIAREAGGALYLAMDNCPHQAILVGEEPAAERAAEIVRREGLMAERLNFDRAYHTPLFAPYVDHLRRVFAEAPIRPARLPIYSCTTAAPYPDDPAAIRKLMLDHWLLPVQFRRTIDVLYEDGVRLFVEVGPRGNLSAFVDDILRGRRFCAIPANVQRRSGIAQLNHLAALLTVHGVDLDLMALYRRRQPRLAPSEGDEPAEVPSRPAARLKLDTGFPAMGVSEEFARRLRGASASPRPEPDRAGAPGDGLIRALRDSAPFSAASSPPDVEVPGGALARDFLRAMDRLLAARGASGEDTRPAAMPMATEGRRAVEPAPLPLLGRVHCETPGVSLVARRTFDPDVDLYLRDHTLGRDVSEADPDLMAMAVMPLAMSLEILAEAAARLVPGQTVIGLRDVRAHRWIAFDGGPQELEVTARIHPDAPDRPVVQLRNRTEDLRSNATSPSPVVEATVLLAGSYPEPPPGGSGGPRDGRPSQLRPDRLYAEIMFHGPRWQGVVSIDRVDGGGAAATLRVLPFGELIRDVPEPHFVLDPVVLDAAGQVVGFWTAERLATGRVVFPFRLEALDVFGPHRRPGEALASLASIRLEGERLVRSDIEVRGPEGRPWMRLVGWEDRRFDLPPALEPLMIPTWRDLSEPWALPIRHGPGARPLVGRRLRLGLAPDRSLWGRVWAARVLTRDERETFRGLEGPEARQLEWLAGRTAAKEAVAELLRDHRGRNPPPAEIEIRVDDSGRLVAEGSWLDPGDDPPVVEIRRGNGHLVALAGFTPAPALALSSASETEEMAGTGTSWESQFRSTDREGGT